MERWTAEKDRQAGFSQEFRTPVKGYQEASQQRSTTANLNSHEQFSFDKMVHRQKMALKYCSANLNELLCSDIKFKSPANLVKVNPSTPARHDWDGSAFFEIVQEYDSAAKFMASKLNLDMTIRKDSLHSLKLREEDLMKESSFGPQPSFEFGHAYRNEFHVDDGYGLPRPSFQVRSSALPGQYALGDACSNSEEFRKRKRKNNLQLKILKNEFSKGDCWNKEKISQVAQITGLSESQVYKWCWDQKKKMEEQENQCKQDAGKMRIESQLRAALMDFGEDDFAFPAELGKPANSLSKRKPERQPFGLVQKTRY